MVRLMKGFMNDTDWKAAISSEIFREYIKGEIIKEAHAQSVPPLDGEQILNEFEEFQQKIRETPHLKIAFKALQEKFINDPIYRSKVNPKFAEGVMLLSLNSEE